MEIFSGYGCTILEREGRYFVQYDSGGSASWLLENGISEEECARAQLSERDAYEVILEAERRSRPWRVV